MSTKSSLRHPQPRHRLSVLTRDVFVVMAALLGVVETPGRASEEVTFEVLTTLHAFFGGDDGGVPQAGLIMATDGYFYGTTNNTVFRMAPTGTLTTLHVFSGPDGMRPLATLLEGADGNFYGTTYWGGATTTCIPPDGCGTVFRLTPGGNLNTLHVFSGGLDGRLPEGPLVQGTDGNFYGTASERGALGGGTIYRLTPSGVLTTVHAFSGPDGRYPHGPLVYATDGNLYGTTSDGGALSSGTVFRLTPAGVLTTLRAFSGGADGGYPSGLLQGADGNFYGTTSFGGGSLCLYSGGCGTAFRLTPSGVLTTLHTFSGPDGLRPFAGLTEGSDGNFYGTTDGGGTTDCDPPYGCGTVFRLTSAGALTTLYSFTGPDGRNPYFSAPIESTDGELVGTTSYGAMMTCGFSRGCGTVFRLTLPRANLRVTTLTTPAAVPSGGALSVTDTTKNDGPGAADPSNTALWLSTNKTLGGDTLLITRTVPELVAGAVNTRTTSLTLPTVAAGVYYLIAQADTDGEVAETNEGDNLKVKTLTIGPDLTAAMAFTPPVPTSITPTTITVTTKNAGGDTAVASLTRLYRSTDGKIGVGDTLLGEFAVPALAAKDTSTNAVTLTLPAGTYYLIAQVDATNAVVEAKETNNVKKVKKTVP